MLYYIIKSANYFCYCLAIYKEKMFIIENDFLGFGARNIQNMSMDPGQVIQKILSMDTEHVI